MGILHTKADENLLRSQGSRRERSKIAQGNSERSEEAALGEPPE
jgi:hypothetical protein